MHLSFKKDLFLYLLHGKFSFFLIQNKFLFEVKLSDELTFVKSK